MALIEPSADLLTELDAIEVAVPGSRAEFVGGQFVVNRPLPLHGRAILVLARLIEDNYLRDGETVVSDVRVVHSRGVIVPDLIVVQEHWLDQPNPIPVDELLLAVEVISPSTETNDRGEKRKIFQAAHVDYWLAAQSRSAEIEERYGYGGGRFSE